MKLKIYSLLFISLVAFAPACKKKQNLTDDNGRLQILQAPHGDAVKTMDPAVAYGSISWDVIPSIYETLFEYSYLTEPYKLVPLLAADMPSFSKDRLSLTIRLRQDIYFQDSPAFEGGKGRKATMHDIVYQIKRLADPGLQSPGWWIFEGKIKGADDFKKKITEAKKEERPKLLLTEKIPGFEIKDDYTLTIHLLRPYPQILYVLAMPFTAAVAHEVVKKLGDETGALQQVALGTGPFILKEFSSGHRIVLEKNPTYRPVFYPTDATANFKHLLADAGKTLPFLDRVILNVIKEDQPRWLQFQNGDIDILGGIPKDNFQSTMTDKLNMSPEMGKKGMVLSIEGGNTFYYIGFNTKDPLVGKNKLLRQAFSSAIDREKFIELFTNGRGQKQNTALPPGVMGRPENPKLKFDFNLDQARALLEKAGFKDGKGLPEITFDMRSADSVSRQMGDYFTQQLAAIGVKLKVIYNTFPAYLEKAKLGHLQVFVGGWAMDYPDAENVFQLLYGPNQSPGPNDVNFNNPQMNALYDQMAKLENGPERSKILLEMDNLLQEETPWALLYYRTSYLLSHGWVKNYRGSEMIPSTYKYLGIDHEKKKELRANF